MFVLSASTKLILKQEHICVREATHVLTLCPFFGPGCRNRKSEDIRRADGGRDCTGRASQVDAEPPAAAEPGRAGAAGRTQPQGQTEALPAAQSGSLQ